MVSDALIHVSSLTEPLFLGNRESYLIVLYGFLCTCLSSITIFSIGLCTNSFGTVPNQYKADLVSLIEYEIYLQRLFIAVLAATTVFVTATNNSILSSVMLLFFHLLIFLFGISIGFPNPYWNSARLTWTYLLFGALTIVPTSLLLMVLNHM